MRGSEIVIMYCPFCIKPFHNDPSNLNTCNINSVNGVYNCFRCNTKGSWYDFKNKVVQKHYGTSPDNLVSQTGKTQFDSNVLQNGGVQDFSNSSNPEFVDILNQQHSGSLNQNLEAYDLKEAHKKHIQFKKGIYQDINDYLTGTETLDQRHIKKEVLEIYRIGVGGEKFRNDNDQLTSFDSVYFPLYAPKSKKSKNKKKKEIEKDKIHYQQEDINCENTMNTDDFELVKMKIRAIGADNKHRMKFMPAGSDLKGLFGLTTIKPEHKAIVITEGEYDAMAVYQETGIPAVSLPNGANHLPVQVLPFFERFERIYLWLDADEVGRNSAEKFAQKLGVKRTIIIDSRFEDENGPKDANDALRMKLDFANIFKKYSRQLGDQNLLTISDMKDSVMKRLLNYTELTGVPSNCFTFFNRTLKGLRKGELTVLTGATGSGKTTFLSQLSIDFVAQGIPTLWGSFEIKNTILASSMLQQYSRIKLTSSTPERIGTELEKFEQHPLYFLNFYGSTQVDLLFETLDYAIYAYDIQYICLDNLQFMLSGQSTGFQRFDFQDKVISMLRQLATEKNVHIALVVHPKKVEDDNNLNVGSVFGSAKTTQEADNVMILQKFQTPNLRNIQIKKNRFDGEVGEAQLIFNVENKRYVEIDQEEEPYIQLNKNTKETPQKKGNKVIQQSENDLKFASLARAHIQNEPIENNISSKNRHLMYSSDNDDSSGGDDGGMPPVDGGPSIPFDPSQSDDDSSSYQGMSLLNQFEDPVGDDYNQVDSVVMTSEEKDHQFKQGKALSHDQITSHEPIIHSIIEENYKINLPHQEPQKANEQQETQEQKVTLKYIDYDLNNLVDPPIKENEDMKLLRQIGGRILKSQQYKQNFKSKQTFSTSFSNINQNGVEHLEQDKFMENQHDRFKNQLQQLQKNPNEVYDKYDNPEPIEINIDEMMHKYISPELRKLVLPVEKKYIYTREADQQDEELQKIAITKESYQRVEQLLRPSYLKDIKPVTSFYDEYTSLQSLKKTSVEIGSVLQPGTRILKSKVDAPKTPKSQSDISENEKLSQTDEEPSNNNLQQTQNQTDDDQQTTMPPEVLDKLVDQINDDINIHHADDEFDDLPDDHVEFESKNQVVFTGKKQKPPSNYKIKKLLQKVKSIMGNQINLQTVNDLQKKIINQLTSLKLNHEVFCLNVCLDEAKNDFLNTIIIDVKGRNDKDGEENKEGVINETPELPLKDQQEKETIVLLHGYGGSATVFYRCFKGIGERFRFILVDLYGLGQSSRLKIDKKAIKKNREAAETYFIEPLEKWRKVMGLDKKFILIGHSMGGYVAACYAMKYHENVKKLILLSPAGFSKLQDRVDSTKNTYLQKKLAKGAEWIWEKNVSAFDLFRKMGVAVTAQYLETYFKRKMPELPREDCILMKDYLIQIFLFPGSGEYAVNWLIHSNGQSRDCLLTRIQCIKDKMPISFMYGDTDWMHGRKEIELSEFKLVIIEGCGHQMHFQNPTNLIKAIFDDVDSYMGLGDFKKEIMIKESIQNENFIVKENEIIQNIQVQEDEQLNTNNIVVFQVDNDKLENQI
eukprot:403330901